MLKFLRLLRSFPKNRAARRRARRLRVELLEDRAVPASTTFAVIGDFGADTLAERDVATLVKSWSPDLIAARERLEYLFEDSLRESLPAETVVYPGHGGVTTIAEETRSNPFLAGRARTLKR